MMEFRLFALLFATGVVSLVLSFPREYYLIQQMETWSDAQDYCRSMYTGLAIIKNKAEMVKFLREAQKHQFTSSAWIGLLINLNRWYWTMGYQPLEWSLWNETQPDIFGRCDVCVRTEEWSWFDEPCTEKYPFVCFDSNKTGDDRYVFYSNNKTWPEALSFCRWNHTDLAGSRNELESSIIQQILTTFAVKTAWFGLFRYTCRWIDNSIVSTVSWMPRQPDNNVQYRSCGYFNKSQVADAQCSDLMPFFCYKDFKRQIVRVKLQSYQNVSDPTLISAILLQINQKLKEQGWNTTVTWRQQKNKVVFTKINEVTRV